METKAATFEDMSDLNDLINWVANTIDTHEPNTPEDDPKLSERYTVIIIKNPL